MVGLAPCRQQCFDPLAALRGAGRPVQWVARLHPWVVKRQRRDERRPYVRQVLCQIEPMRAGRQELVINIGAEQDASHAQAGRPQLSDIT